MASFGQTFSELSTLGKAKAIIPPLIAGSAMGTAAYVSSPKKEKLEAAASGAVVGAAPFIGISMAKLFNMEGRVKLVNSMISRSKEKLQEVVADNAAKVMQHRNTAEAFNRVFNIDKDIHMSILSERMAQVPALRDSATYTNKLRNHEKTLRDLRDFKDPSVHEPFDFEFDFMRDVLNQRYLDNHAIAFARTYAAKVKKAATPDWMSRQHVHNPEGLKKLIDLGTFNDFAGKGFSVHAAKGVSHENALHYFGFSEKQQYKKTQVNEVFKKFWLANHPDKFPGAPEVKIKELTRKMQEGNDYIDALRNSDWYTKLGFAKTAASVNLPFVRVQSADRKTSSEIDIAGNTIAAGALPTGAAALLRKSYQSKIDPNRVDVVGGFSDKLRVGNKTYTTVFDTQRQNWATLFRDNNYKVTEYGRDNHLRAFDTFIPLPTDRAINVDSTGKPIVTLHVGSGPAYEAKARIKDKLFGGSTYRVFSDFGPGSQQQPRYDMTQLQKNMMHAPSNHSYKRNVVPGGDDLPGTIEAQKGNINVTSIPSQTSKWDASVPNANKKPLVSVSYGSGHVWSTNRFPDHEKHFDTMIKGLDEHYGKGNYRMSVLGGPNTSDVFDSYFKGLSKRVGKDYTYGRKTSQKGFMNLVTKSDLHIMGPGSSIAEIAALKGKKPKIITMITDTAISPHQRANTEWARRHLGAVEEAMLDKSFTTEKFKVLLNAVKTKAPLASAAAVTANADDVAKIIDRAKADLVTAKGVTKRLGKAALIGIGAGLGLKGVSALWKKYEEK